MPDMPMLPQMRQGGLWRTDGGFQSTFMLKSILEIAPIPVTPILYMADGTEYDLPQVQMDVAGTAMVNINSALQAAPANIQAHMSTYGSAALKFSWSHPIAVYTSILISDEVRSLSYMTHLEGDDTETNGPKAVQVPRVIEGMWWKQESDVTGFLSVTNTSANTVPAALQVFNADASSVATSPLILAPHNTNLIDLSTMFAQLPAGTAEGGLRISFTGSLDAIVAEGGMEQEQKGYSAMFHFVTKKVSQQTASGSASTQSTSTTASQPQTTTLDSAGMMIGTQDADMLFPQGTQFTPYVVMRNLASQPMQVNMAANITQQGTPIDIPLGGITLAPLASQQVDIKTMLTVAGLGTLNGLLNLRASFTGNPGDLMEETGSVDQSLTYVFEVPARTEKWSHSKIIDVWNTATDTDTMINLWNYSNKDEDLILTFFHHTGQYQLPIHLAAHASMAMSVASLIKSGTPDTQGRRIPTNTVLGSAKISGVNGDHTHIDVAANVGIFNVRTGTCHYALITCDGVCDGWATPNPMNLTDGIGDYDDVSAIIQFYDGHCEDVTDEEEFSTEDDEVVTVACTYCGTVQVTGVGIGRTSVVASDEFQGYNPDDHVCPDDCPVVDVSFTATVLVSPNILLGGDDINDTTQNVVLGQQIALTTTSSPISSSVTLLSVLWIVDGDYVDGYSPSSASAATPGIPAVNGNSITYYWAVPRTSAQVRFQMTLSDGSQPTATATFNIAGPTSPTITVTNYGLFKVNTLTGCPGLGVPTAPWLMYGNLTGTDPACGTLSGTPGIQFTVPSTTTPSGSFSLVQLVNSDEVTLNGTTSCTSSGGLDLEYPYPNTYDAPLFLIPSGNTSAGRVFSATMWLFWTPSVTPSIPVPLGSVTWDISGSATLSGSTWTPTGSGGPTGGFVAADGFFPTWSGVSSCH
jgi:hypothetical protein